MNESEIANIRSWLDSFVGEHSDRDGNLHPLLQIKHEHTLRVAGDCRDIAMDLGWTPDDINTASAVGLLHDVGRFPQFRRYGTYEDSRSENHAAWSCAIVEDSRLLAGCSPRERDIVMDSIRHHNRRLIPEDLSEDSARFLRLLRDADKLDIIFAVTDPGRTRFLRDYPGIYLSVAPEGPASPALLQQLLDHRSASYEHVRTLTDMTLLCVTWAYDMNYTPTLRRLQDRGLLARAEGLLPDLPEIRRVVDGVRRHVAARIEEAAG